MTLKHILIPKVKIYRLDNQKYLNKLDLSTYEIKDLVMQRKRHVLAINIYENSIKLDIRSLELTVAKHVPLIVSIIARIAEEIKESSDELRQNVDNTERLLTIIKSIVIKYERELADMLIREIKIIHIKDEFGFMVFIIFED